MIIVRFHLERWFLITSSHTDYYSLLLCCMLFSCYTTDIDQGYVWARTHKFNPAIFCMGLSEIRGPCCWLLHAIIGFRSFFFYIIRLLVFSLLAIMVPYREVVLILLRRIVASLAIILAVFAVWSIQNSML